MMKNLRYADDIALIASSHEHLQKLLNIVVTESENVGFTLNVKKTQTIVISKSGLAPAYESNDSTSSFQELLHIKEEVIIRERNRQKRMLEVHRCMTSESPSFLWELFNKKVLIYSLRTNNLLQHPNTRTKTYGNESLSFRGSIIWNQLPDQYKDAKTNNEFKKKFKVGRDLNLLVASVYSSSFCTVHFSFHCN